MRITIVGKNMQVRDSVRETLEAKLMKLDKFFESDVDAKATLSHIKDLQVAEVTIFLKNGAILRAEETARDLDLAIDSVMDKIVRQLRKHKTNIEKRFRKNASIRYDALAPVELPTLSAEAEHETEETEIKIVRTKAFSVKPMSPEEAVLQMEMLGHNFYVYQNDHTNALNVVYKRRQGDYGLIEAQI